LDLGVSKPNESVLIKAEKDTQIQRRRPHKDQGEDWSDAASGHQKLKGARKDFPLEHSEGVQCCCQPDVRHQNYGRIHLYTCKSCCWSYGQNRSHARVKRADQPPPTSTIWVSMGRLKQSEQPRGKEICCLRDSALKTEK
jgi:hypothetical protein